MPSRSRCTCSQDGDFCPVHPNCVCGCPKHAHANAGAGECFRGDLECRCPRYMAEIDLHRFPATTALTWFWALVPAWIDIDEAAGTKVLRPEAYALELQHWDLTLRVTDGRGAPFIKKRIEDMTDYEFRRWCVQSSASLRDWCNWIKENACVL